MPMAGTTTCSRSSRAGCHGRCLWSYHSLCCPGSSSPDSTSPTASARPMLCRCSPGWPSCSSSSSIAFPRASAASICCRAIPSWPFSYLNISYGWPSGRMRPSASTSVCSAPLALCSPVCWLPCAPVPFPTRCSTAVMQPTTLPSCMPWPISLCLWPTSAGSRCR